MVCMVCSWIDRKTGKRASRNYNNCSRKCFKVISMRLYHHVAVEVQPRVLVLHLQFHLTPILKLAMPFPIPIPIPAATKEIPQRSSLTALRQGTPSLKEGFVWGYVIHVYYVIHLSLIISWYFSFPCFLVLAWRQAEHREYRRRGGVIGARSGAGTQGREGNSKNKSKRRDGQKQKISLGHDVSSNDYFSFSFSWQWRLFKSLDLFQKEKLGSRRERRGRVWGLPYKFLVRRDFANSSLHYN